MFSVHQCDLWEKTNTKPQKVVVFSKPDFSLKCKVQETKAIDTLRKKFCEMVE